MGPVGNEKVHRLNKLWSAQERMLPIESDYSIPAKQWETMWNNLEICGTGNCELRQKGTCDVQISQDEDSPMNQHPVQGILCLTYLLLLQLLKH